MSTEQSLPEWRPEFVRFSLSFCCMETWRLPVCERSLCCQTWSLCSYEWMRKNEVLQLSRRSGEGSQVRRFVLEASVFRERESTLAIEWERKDIDQER
jgi:hypothetical protein